MRNSFQFVAVVVILLALTVFAAAKEEDLRQTKASGAVHCGKSCPHRSLVVKLQRENRRLQKELRTLRQEAVGLLESQMAATAISSSNSSSSSGTTTTTTQSTESPSSFIVMNEDPLAVVLTKPPEVQIESTPMDGWHFCNMKIHTLERPRVFFTRSQDFPLRIDLKDPHEEEEAWKVPGLEMGNTTKTTSGSNRVQMMLMCFNGQVFASSASAPLSVQIHNISDGIASFRAVVVKERETFAIDHNYLCTNGVCDLVGPGEAMDAGDAHLDVASIRLGTDLKLRKGKDGRFTYFGPFIDLEELLMPPNVQDAVAAPSEFDEYFVVRQNLLSFKYKYIDHSICEPLFSEGPAGASDLFVAPSEEVDIFFVMDACGPTAFAHWVMENLVSVFDFLELKRVKFPRLKLLVTGKKDYKRLFLERLGVDWDSVVDASEALVPTKRNICIIQDVIANHELDRSKLDRWHYRVKRLFEALDFPEPPSKRIPLLYLPRQYKENGAGGNERFIKNTEEFMAMVMDPTRGGTVCNTADVTALADQMETVQSSEVILVDFGSAFLMNGMFSRNATIIVLDWIAFHFDYPIYGSLLKLIEDWRGNVVRYVENDEKDGRTLIFNSTEVRIMVDRAMASSKKGEGVGIQI